MKRYDIECDTCGREFSVKMDQHPTFCILCGAMVHRTDDSSECWCDPEVIHEEGGEVVVHRERH